MADKIKTGERSEFKAINFDLHTDKMKEKGVYPEGYKTLGNAFAKYGFEHRQGSGYVSKHKLTTYQVYKITKEITKEIDWLKDCVNKMDVTDIGKQYDLTSLIKETAEVAQNKDVNSLKDLVACTIEQCGKRIDFEIAQERLRTQKENMQQQIRQVEQVGQVQQVRKGKTKIKEEKDNSGKR